METITATILQELRQHKGSERPFIIAIDGRCGSGKSTLAAALQAALGCPLIHMDDFFLRTEQRTPERYAEPGGNVDRERFLEEVLMPLKENRPFSYRPLSCQTFTFTEAIEVIPSDYVIIEGSYSCHEALRKYYDLRIFLTVDPKTQMARITARNPVKAELFRTKWIPLEERYFEVQKPECCCEHVFET